RCGTQRTRPPGCCCSSMPTWVPLPALPPRWYRRSSTARPTCPSPCCRSRPVPAVAACSPVWPDVPSTGRPGARPPSRCPAGGATAVNAAPLVPPVLYGKADLSIAVLPKQAGAGGRGLVTGLARRSIHRATGWAPTQPLSGQRCMTRAAFDAATPLAHGWGVETGMTMDVLQQGFAVVEVPCDLSHRAGGSDIAGQLHRAAQYRDVMMAVAARRFRHYKHKIARDAEVVDDGAAPVEPSAHPEGGSPGAGDGGPRADQDRSGGEPGSSRSERG